MNMHAGVEEPEHSHAIQQVERNCPTGDDANERKALTGQTRRYKILAGILVGKQQIGSPRKRTEDEICILGEQNLMRKADVSGCELNFAKGVFYL
jgi:hypothetical protein